MKRWLQNSSGTRHTCKSESASKYEPPLLKVVLFPKGLLLVISPDVGELGCPVHGHGVLDEAVAAVEGQLLLRSPSHHGWYESMGTPGSSRSLYVHNVYTQGKGHLLRSRGGNILTSSCS